MNFAWNNLGHLLEKARIQEGICKLWPDSLGRLQPKANCRIMTPGGPTTAAANQD